MTWTSGPTCALIAAAFARSASASTSAHFDGAVRRDTSVRMRSGQLASGAGGGGEAADEPERRLLGALPEWVVGRDGEDGLGVDAGRRGEHVGGDVVGV